MIDANHLVFVVVDGRSPGYSKGVTMTQMAEIMKGLGATTAYNLDGGGSSTMYFNGSVASAEDALPGGFDNPDGSTPPPYAKGWGATKFAIQSLLVTLALASLGLCVQFG